MYIDSKNYNTCIWEQRNNENGECRTSKSLANLNAPAQLLKSNIKDCKGQQ